MTEDREKLVERLRAKVFAGPAEDQRLKLVAQEAADLIEAQAAEIARVRVERDWLFENLGVAWNCDDESLEQTLAEARLRNSSDKDTP